MSNLFKAVRIVHSPEDKCYFVQQRKLWRLLWTTVNVLNYVERVNPHNTLDQQGAYELAKRQAESLLAHVVVWEKKNYFYGP